jgi:hypothetical protein
MTLEELMVVSSPQVTIKRNIVDVEFTPTVPHCGASTLIGKPFVVYVLSCVHWNLQACLFEFAFFEVFRNDTRLIFMSSPGLIRASMQVYVFALSLMDDIQLKLYVYSE